MSLARYPVLLLVASLLATSLAGCAGWFAREDDNQTSSFVAQTQPATALHLIVPVSSPENDARLMQLVADIEALNPSIGISVTLSSAYETDLPAQLSAGSPPDLFLLTGSSLPNYVSDDIVTPISHEWIEQSRLLEVALLSATVDGVTYCFPHSLHTLAVVYNMDLFEAAGESLPTSDWTWQELADVSVSLSDDEAGVTGLVLDPNLIIWTVFYHQAGGAFTEDGSGEYNLSPSAAQQSSEYFANLFLEGGAATPAMLDASWSGEAFARGDVAMTIAGDWMVSHLADRGASFQYGFVELPAGPGGKATIAFTNCLAVHANSENRDLALQLAAQLTAPEVLPDWTLDAGDGLSIYSIEDASPAPDESSYLPYIRSLRYARPWRLGSLATERPTLIADAVEMVVDEDIAPQDLWPYLVRNGL